MKAGTATRRARASRAGTQGAPTPGGRTTAIRKRKKSALGDLKGSETSDGMLKGTGEDTGLKLKGSDDGDLGLKSADDTKPKKKRTVYEMED